MYGTIIQIIAQYQRNAPRLLIILSEVHHTVHRVLALFLFLIFASTISARAAVPPSHPLLLARDRTEPVVAVDPRNPSTIVAGSNTNYDAPIGDLFPVASFSSQDGGTSFTAGNIPILRPYTVAADPSISIARDGTVFYSYLGETPAYCSNGGGAVLLTHSTDHGRSFRTPVVVDADAHDDKPWSSVENIHRGYAHLFVTWSREYDQRSEIWYSRSTDGGVHFSPPTLLFGSSQGNSGSTPLVSGHGRVAVFWTEYSNNDPSQVGHARILMRTSTDDGAHFSPVRSIVGSFLSLPRQAGPGSLRDLPFPAVAVHGRTLYVSWAAVTRQYGHATVDANIMLSRSTDGGTTWSAPQRVNDSQRSDRFMPAMSVFRDGSVGLAFYDRRRSRWQLDVYAAHISFAGGFHRSPNVRVSQGTSNIADIYYVSGSCFSHGRFFGDYIGTAPLPNNTLGVVWADTALHVSQHTDIWFARVSVPLARHVSRTG